MQTGNSALSNTYIAIAIHVHNLAEVNIATVCVHVHGTIGQFSLRI